MVAYPAIVHQEDDQYWVEFPDVPGCFSSADTLPELLTHAADALGLMLSEIAEPMPSPSDIAAITPEDGFTTMIVTEPAKFKRDTRAVKKTLTIPAWLNTEAENRHINFSSVLKEALISALAQ